MKALKLYRYRHERMGLYCAEIYAYSIADAKRRIKAQHGYKRMPNGFEIW